MGLLEKVNQMKKEGASDTDIINELQEQGIPPKTIQDTLSQSEIKHAISKEEPEEYSQEEQNYSPSLQEMPPTPSENFYSGQQYPSQEYVSQENLSQDYSYSQGGIDTDTIIEISEQVFSEKIKEIQKQTEAFQEFSTIATTKIENLQERLKRIETTIDKLQLSILDKVGSYGQDLDMIKKEMSMIENSFSKVISKKK